MKLLEVALESAKFSIESSHGPFSQGAKLAKISAYQTYQVPAATIALPDLEVVKNHYPDRETLVRFEIPEFTCICPKTGLPDFALLRVEYVPAKLLVELKSLKLYVHGFRNLGIFHESVANRVLDDLVRASRPRRARLTADFSVRGGIHTVVEAAYRWKNPG
jgi:7-cyano-7-deazaguanine reductase